MEPRGRSRVRREARRRAPGRDLSSRGRPATSVAALKVVDADIALSLLREGDDALVPRAAFYVDAVENALKRGPGS